MVSHYACTESSVYQLIKSKMVHSRGDMSVKLHKCSTVVRQGQGFYSPFIRKRDWKVWRIYKVNRTKSIQTLTEDASKIENYGEMECIFQTVCYKEVLGDYALKTLYRVERYKSRRGITRHPRCTIVDLKRAYYRPNAAYRNRIGVRMDMIIIVSIKFGCYGQYKESYYLLFEII